MYWKTWAVASLLAMLAAPMPAPAARGPLRILGADAAPLFFQRDGVISGFCAEVVKDIQRRIGDRTPMQVVPWVRAYRTALAGENVVLACPKRTPSRETLFKWVGPLLDTHTNLYALRSAGLPSNTVVPVLPLMNTQSYLTFPSDAPEAQVAQWRQALEAMKQDGTFARLQKQWFTHR